MKRLRLLKPRGQADPHLKRFDGVENIRERRCGRWSDAGDIGVVNIMIPAVEQIQELGRNLPCLVDLITGFGVEQQR